jgi:hypothetical protein
MGGFIAIIVTLFLCIGIIIFVERREEIISRKYKLDPTQAVKREFSEKLRYEYRKCIPKLKINGKR